MYGTFRLRGHTRRLQAPDFGEVIAEHDYAPEAWPDHAYDELMAQGHPDANASGKTMGLRAFGCLSADGRNWVRQQRKGGGS